MHGRGQAGLQVADLQAEWLSALAEGAQALGRRLPQGLDVAFPFYGDALEEIFVKRSNLPSTSDVIARGGQPDDDFLAFQAEVAQSMRAGAGVTDEQILTEYGDNPKQRGPLNWEWVHAIFRAIDKHGGGLSGDVIEQFLRDVYLYVTVETVRETIDRIVRAKLDERKTVIVCHRSALSSPTMCCEMRPEVERSALRDRWLAAGHQGDLRSAPAAFLSAACASLV